MGLGDWFRERFMKEDEIPEPMRSCSRCGFEYPEALMLGDTTGKYCSECFDKKKKEGVELAAKKRQDMLTQKIKYHCYECKFNFSRKRDFPLQMCPNCGSRNFVPESRMM